MPTGKYVSFSILGISNVNETRKSFPEYIIRNQYFTEVDLHGPSSYTIEEDGQKYPVLPFMVVLQRLCQQTVWINIYLDGQQIRSRPLFHKEFTCDGVKVGTEIRELLFSLPKITEHQDKKNPLGEYAGTIRVEVWEARCVGNKFGPVFSTGSVLSTNCQDHKLQHLTKKDVMQVPKDKVQLGCLVSREGRATYSLTHTGKFKNLQRYEKTSNLLEELVLHYRPIISSHTPSHPTPPIKQEVRQPRTPLSDIRNITHQETARESMQQAENSNQMLRDLQVEASQDSRNILVKNNSMKHEEKRVTVGESLPVTVDTINTRHTDQSPTSVIPPEEIKRRESMVPALIQPEKVKHRESCASALIPPQDINDHDSLASAMIPPEKIKHRDSLAPTLLPPEKIKHRDSCASALIPPQDIKNGDSCASPMIPPERIKRRVSYPPNIDADLSEANSLMEDIVIVDDDDDKDGEVCVYDANDDSIVLMGWDQGLDCSMEGDSVLYMGDDDCCVLDVSLHQSIVEVDESMIDME